MSSKRVKGSSLKGRFIVVTTAILFSVSTFAGLLRFAVSWEYHMRRVYNTIGRMADDLRNEYHQLRGKEDEFFRHMEIDVEEHDVSRTFIILSTVDGHAIRATAMPTRIQDRILHEVVNRRREHRFYTERSSPTDRHIAVRMKSLELNDGNLITVARDVTDIERYLLFLALTQGISIVLATILTGGVVTLISARFVRRLNTVATTAAAIESGDWSCRVEGEKSETREIRALIQAFNGMCDKNERTLNEMRVLTDNMAHDLRTPLTRLSMAAETALFDATAREALPDRILNETRNMLEMINTMLDIAQIGAQIDRSPKAELNLTRLVQDMGELYQPLAEQNGVALAVSTPEKPVTFLGQRAKLQQLVGNLLENAIKYTPHGGQIDIRLEVCETDVCLIVSDTGCGIDEKDIPHIYKRFWRADSSRSRPGNGLGLALVHAIVTSYGGSIRCDSTLGKGSTFTIHLPCT